MFNLKKQEITMKKYIAPAVRILDLDMESVVALSETSGSGDGVDLSNRREDFSSASESIWGNGWEE